MVCSNCKHELNPLARVCPTCGTPAPGATPAPAAMVQPPVPEALPPKRGVTAARVFVVIFCVMAVVLNALLAASWFIPAVRVTTRGGSIRTYSMYQLCQGASYLTWTVCALCFLSAVFCVIPLFRHYAARRCRLLIPKLMALLCAGCYAAPYLVVSIAKTVTGLVNGGEIDHSNPFTSICLGLFILLCVTSELSILNRRLVSKHQIEDLRAQLTAHGIRPVA